MSKFTREDALETADYYGIEIAENSEFITVTAISGYVVLMTQKHCKDYYHAENVWDTIYKDIEMGTKICVKENCRYC